MDIRQGTVYDATISSGLLIKELTVALRDADLQTDLALVT